jgi:hypothetical protein
MLELMAAAAATVPFWGGVAEALPTLTRSATVNFSQIAGQPFALVTPGGPDDGGDFGPNTKGSTTCGIQEAVNASKNVFIAPGTYNFPGGFSKIIVQGTNKQVVLAYGALLAVPANYAGFVFEVNDLAASAANISIKGGQFMEQGAAPANNWKGIRLYSHSDNGVFYCDFQDTWFGLDAATFSKCNVAIQFDMDSATSFINNNYFANHKVFDPVTAGFNWNATSTSHHFNQNTFVHEQIEMASGGASAVGFKGVDGESNVFVNCVPADAAGSQATATIAATASATQIFGGQLDGFGYVDSSTNTRFPTQIVAEITGAQLYQVSTKPGGAVPIIFANAASGVQELIFANNGGTIVQTDGAANFYIVNRLLEMNGIGTNLTTGNVIQVAVKAGVPTDADFNSPANGLVVIDTTDSKIYARVGGVWKGALLS